MQCTSESTESLITDPIGKLVAEFKLKSKCQGTKLEKQYTSVLQRVIYREGEYYHDITKEFMQYRKSQLQHPLHTRDRKK